MIIWVYMFGFFSLAQNGYASVEKKDLTYSISSPRNQKVILVDLPADKDQDDVILLELRSRAPLTLTVNPAIRENSNVLILSHQSGVQKFYTVSEKVLSDHLLHLFPSHYFW